MAVAFQSAGAVAELAANNNSAVTVGLPGTRPAGSVCLLITQCQSITATPTITGTGWTLFPEFPKTSGTASGGRIYVYGCPTNSLPATTTFTWNGATGTTGDWTSAYMVCYSGVSINAGTGLPQEDGTTTVTDASGTTTCTEPAITTNVIGTMIVRFLVRLRDAVDTFTPDAGHNERVDSGSTTRLGGQVHLQDKVTTATGSQASVTVAPSNTTAARYLAISMGLKATSSLALPHKFRNYNMLRR